jgi:hypothetical protein
MVHTEPHSSQSPQGPLQCWPSLGGSGAFQLSLSSVSQSHNQPQCLPGSSEAQQIILGQAQWQVTMHSCLSVHPSHFFNINWYLAHVPHTVLGTGDPVIIK